MSWELGVALAGIISTFILGVGTLYNNKRNRDVGVSKVAEDRLDAQVDRTFEAMERRIKLLEDENKELRERKSEDK